MAAERRIVGVTSPSPGDRGTALPPLPTDRKPGENVKAWIARLAAPEVPRSIATLIELRDDYQTESRCRRQVSMDLMALASEVELSAEDTGEGTEAKTRVYLVDANAASEHLRKLREEAQRGGR